MSALVRKETRLLLGSWVAALAVATLPLWMGPGLFGLFPTVYAVAILALALSSFGQETSRGTFSLMLVQPVDRRRLWRVKTRLLAIALLTVWGLLALCLWPRQEILNPDGWGVWLLMTGLMTLLAFSGGLWSALLLRDMVSAFTCACVVPGLIMAATILTVGHWIAPTDKRFSTILCWILAAYGVAGVFGARRLFLEAQDVGWGGSQVFLSAGRSFSLGSLGFKFNGKQNRWLALIKKELQLQQAMMVLVPLLALMQAVTLAFVHFFPDWKTPQVLAASGIPGIWLAVVPLIIGCVAVAEERRFNTLECLLCLAVSKRALFAVKLACALVMSIVLGGIIPWALAHIGGVSPEDFKLRDLIKAAAIICGIGFYASSLSRSLLQALPAAFCVVVLAAGVIDLLIRCYVTFVGDMGYGAVALFFALTWPVAIITAVGLAFLNFKQLHTGWQLWLGNLIRSGAVFGCVTVATMGIFERSWELFLPLEPRHGPAQITGTGRPAIAATESNVFVVLPDRRMWIGMEDSPRASVSGRFVAGSNWLDIAANYAEAFAIRSDGTLWKLRDQTDMRQIGSDSDWKKIAAGGGVFLALKQNGTLWGWGQDHHGILKMNSTGTSKTNISAPVRVGKDTDWVDVYVPNDIQGLGVKRDGSTWLWGNVPERIVGTRIVETPQGQLVRWKMDGTNWVSLVSMGNGYLSMGIRTDGSLWAAGAIPPEVFGQNAPAGLHAQPVRVGTKSDWIALAGHGDFAALEADGALWAMGYHENKRPSKYSDWIGATEAYGCTWALAKDGTVSCWNEFEPREYSTLMGEITLGPTRRPVFSGNIINDKY